uniref:Uncharacterized protein n=1 Tax=Arundo donax TaxID=35708 RepID=A0A0A9C460_ARUDO
MRSRSLVR